MSSKTHLDFRRVFGVLLAPFWPPGRGQKAVTTSGGSLPWTPTKQWYVWYLLWKGPGSVSPFLSLFVHMRSAASWHTLLHASVTTFDHSGRLWEAFGAKMGAPWAHNVEQMLCIPVFARVRRFQKKEASDTLFCSPNGDRGPPKAPSGPSKCPFWEKKISQKRCPKSVLAI